MAATVSPPPLLSSAPPLFFHKKKLVLAPRFGAWDAANAGPVAPGDGGDDDFGADARRVSREPGRYSAAFDLLRAEHSGTLADTRGAPGGGRWDAGEDTEGGMLTSPELNRNERMRESACGNESGGGKYASGSTEREAGAQGSWERSQGAKAKGETLDDRLAFVSAHRLDYTPTDRLGYTFTDRLEDILEHPTSSCSSGSQASGVDPGVTSGVSSDPEPPLQGTEGWSGLLAALGETPNEVPWFTHSRAFLAHEVQRPLFASSPPSPPAPAKEALCREAPATEGPSKGIPCGTPATTQAVHHRHTPVSASASASAPASGPLAPPKPFTSLPWFRKPAKAQTSQDPRTASPRSSAPPSSPPASSPPAASPPASSSPTSLSTGYGAPRAPAGPQEPNPRHTAVPASASVSGPLARPQPWFRTLFQVGRTQSCEQGRVPKGSVPAARRSGPQALAPLAPAHEGYASGVPRTVGRAQSCEEGVDSNGGALVVHPSGPRKRGESASGGVQRDGHREHADVGKSRPIEKAHTETELDSFKFEPLVLNWDSDALTGDILSGGILNSSILHGSTPGRTLFFAQAPLSPQPLSPQSSFTSHSADSLNSGRGNSAHADVSSAHADVVPSPMARLRPPGRPGLPTSPHTQDLTALLPQEAGSGGASPGTPACDKSASCPAQEGGARQWPLPSSGADTWQRSESTPTRPGQAARRRPVLAPKFGAWEVPGPEGAEASLGPPGGGGGAPPAEGDATVTSWEGGNAGADAAGWYSYSNVFLRLREYHNGTEGVPRPQAEGTALHTGVPGAELGSSPARRAAAVAAAEAGTGKAGRPRKPSIWRFRGRGSGEGGQGLVERSATEPQSTSRSGAKKVHGSRWFARAAPGTG